MFEELKSRDADIIARKVQLVAGDCEQLDLGLSSADRHTLANEVTIVLHGAANVKFDQDIRGATNINVRAVREMLKLAGDMHQLVAFVYISTLFAFCTQKKIDERFYDVPITAEKLLTLLEILDDDTLKTITPQYSILFVIGRIVQTERGLIASFCGEILKNSTIERSTSRNTILVMHELSCEVSFCSCAAARSIKIGMLVAASSLRQPHCLINRDERYRCCVQFLKSLIS